MSIFTDEDMTNAEKYGNLGPAYFMARRVTENAVQSFNQGHAEKVKSIIDKAASDLRDQLWDSVRDSLWADTEMNLQGMMWRGVDDVVKALLGGDQWALDRYVNGPSYDCAKIRAAVAVHISDDVAKGRIADLEAEIVSLKKSLEWARR